jgi:hypothetical protein
MWSLRNLLKASSPHFLSPYLPFTLPTTSRTDTQSSPHHELPNSAPTNLSAFSLWPDALAASEEESGMWAQPAEYAEPGVAAVEGIPLDILDAVLAWGQSGTTPALRHLPLKQIL